MCPRKRISPTSTLLSVLLLALPAAPTLADQTLYNDATRALETGQYQQAYQLLDKASEQHAGEPKFDYLYGRAALQAGHPAEAMLALERVIQRQPNHAAARMDLVAAYTQLGLNHQAQRQLEILESQQPPPAARQAMERYQDILRPRLSGTPDPVRLIALSAGYDSNVGSYPDMDLLGFIPIEPVESSYGLLRGTLWHPWQLNEQSRLDFTLHGQYRDYHDKDAEQFNLGLLHTGVRYNHNLNPSSRIGIGLQGNKLWLDGDGFRDHLGLTSRWEQRLSPDRRGDVGLEWLDYRFDNDSHDYQQTNLHGRLHQRIGPRIHLTGLLGYEQEDARNGRPGGDAQRWRVRGEANWQLNPRNRLGMSLGWSDTRYKDRYAPGMHNPTAQTIKRDDQTTDFTANWRTQPARLWEINTELSYRDQRSSVEFYNTDRWTGQLTLLRHF